MPAPARPPAVRGPALLGLAGAAAAAGLVSYLAPAGPLPPPPGPHRVGTRTVLVRGQRALPVQAWYPTAEVGPAAPLFPHPTGVARALANVFPVPAGAFLPLRWVRGHAIADARPAGSDLPVVLLVHGWMGFRTIHADIAEHLASTGHVVLAADHAGGSLATQYPDGTVVGLDRTLLPPPPRDGRAPSSMALVARYAEDLADVLDIAPGLFAEGGMHVDVDQTVAVGHSTGGGAAVRCASTDPRIMGIVGMDPWVVPVATEHQAADVPIVAIRSDEWVGGPNDRVLAAMPDVELRTLTGSVHTDFTALGFFSPVLRMVGMTAAPPQQVHDAVVGAATALLDRIG